MRYSSHMAKSIQSLEQITKELYKKNLDLFNVNRQLKILRKLDQIMMSDLQVKDVAQEFIKILTQDLEFDSGFVCLEHNDPKGLKIVAHTKSPINEFITKETGKKLTSLVFADSDNDNYLIKSMKGNRRYTAKNPSSIWYPNLGEEDFSVRLSKNRNYQTLVQPITFGSRVLGVFALSANRELTMTKLDKSLIKQISNVFGIAIDRVTLYQDLRKANRELRKLDKLKDEFVYIATHELKTPVTVMKGYLSMLDNGSFGPMPKEFKEPMHEITLANQQLILLVNDLLDIARSENKQLNLKTQAVELSQIIKETLKNVEPLATEKGLKLKYENEGPLMITADEDKLREVCNNLLSNAIKYSEEGTIEITHAIERNMVITHIKDQGHGISERDQKKLFTRFFRADDVATKAPGTGLGLFIVKQLVEKLGGRIWFSSTLGKGTTFSFSLQRSE